MTEAARPTPPPFRAYTGDGEYVFVCYAHADARDVYQELVEQNAHGTQFWYDEGIRPNSDWTAEIADALNGCSRVIFFASEQSTASKYCRRELHYAVSRDKPVTVVYLEPIALPDDLELQLGLTQAIHRHGLSDEDYSAKLGSALRGQSSRARRPGRLAAMLTTVIIAAALVAYWTQRPEPAVTGPPQVMVLPFQNASADQNQAYIGDAMAEGIWSRLSHQPALRAVSMTSARAAQIQGMHAQDLANRLGVKYVVEGSIVQRGENTRVSVRVIEADTGTALWNERYDRDFDSVNATFAVYDEIALDVANAFNVRLVADPHGQAPLPSNIAAKNFVDEAMFLYRAGETERIDTLLDLALEADPDYARAHLAKGWHTRNRGDTYHTLPTGEAYERANRHYDRALALDPNYALAYSHKAAMIMRTEFDYRKAREYFAKADDLGVGVMGVSDKGRLLILSGRLEEALVLFESVKVLDPLFVALRIEALGIYEEQGRYEEGIALIDELIAVTSRNVWLLHIEKVRFATRLGRYQDARELLAIPEYLPTQQTAFFKAYIDAHEGISMDAFRAFVEASERERGPLRHALARWLLEDYDAHLDWIDQTFAEEFALDVLPRIIRMTGGYWETLERWASAEDTDARRVRIAALRQQIADIEAKMDIAPGMSAL